MKARTFHIGASFAIVLVAYWTYALLALPWIETPLKPLVDHRDDKGRGTKGADLDPNRPDYPELADLFPAEVLRDTKIISSNDQVLLLWKTYANKADNWVELNPLSVVFVSDEAATDRGERFRHAIVMDVPGGAHLRFDRPLDLKHGTGIGRLIDGRLIGPVTIRRRGRQPEHQDDLLVKTHDVEITEQRITTPNQVEFSFGGSSGRGRQLEITLLPRLGERVANREGPDIGGIKQIQLEHVERLHMETGTSAVPTANAPAGGALSGGLSKPSGPMEITCRGPFCFKLDDQVATFRDQVEVLRMHPDGPSDHVNCELLGVYFTRPPHAGIDTERSKSHGAGLDLQPERIEAIGQPAILTAPIEHLQATAGTLQYNLVDGQVYLEDRKEVVLQKDRDEIHTPSLHYVPGPPGHEKMFQLVSGGPGWLRTEMASPQAAVGREPGIASRPLSGQVLEARWQAKLEVRPQDQKQVISLTGGAALNFQAMGQLDAREIHFRLREVATANGQSDFEPDQLFALDNVRGNSPQFSCHAEERMDVWFTSVTVAGGAQPANASAAPATVGPSPAPYLPSIAATPAPALVSQFPTATAGQQGHMEIGGRLLQARVVVRDRQQGELTEVTVIDRVKLRETQTAEPSAKPLLVTGDRLHAIDVNLPQAKAVVQGKPAHMEGRGMSLTGPTIDIDRGTNRLVMEGAGEMESITDHDLENRPLNQPTAIHITWQKSMLFDGRKAHFQDAVKVRSATQVLETGWMDVGFEHAISFTDARSQQAAKVETIHCGDGVYVVNQSIEAGQQMSYDRIHLKGLDLNNLTGEFHADGPGRVISVRRGGGMNFAMLGGPLGSAGTSASGTPVRPAAFVPGQPPANSNEMTCLDLRFMKSVTGNKNRKDCTFHGDVRAACAAAQSWETTLEDDDPNRFPKGSGQQMPGVLHCETLEIADMGPMGGGGGGMEAQARDNVIAESSTFFARGERMSFSQAKDWLIFEGDGRSDAELYKQEGVGNNVTPAKAQKITYYLKTRDVDVSGFHSAQIVQPPQKAK